MLIGIKKNPLIVNHPYLLVAYPGLKTMSTRNHCPYLTSLLFLLKSRLLGVT